MARLTAGPAILVDQRACSEGGELPVQARSDDREVVPIATVVEARASLVGVNRRAGVAHADYVVNPSAGLAVVAVKVDVQSFNLRRKIVGEGVLNASANRPAPVVVAAVPGRAEHVRRGNGGSSRLEISQVGSARSWRSTNVV